MTYQLNWIFRDYRVIVCRMAIIVYPTYWLVNYETCIGKTDGEGETILIGRLPSAGLKSSFQSDGLHQPHAPPHITNATCLSSEMSWRKMYAI